MSRAKARFSRLTPNHRDGSGSWLYATLIAPSTSQAIDFFGSAVAIEGQQILVGAPFCDRPPMGEIPQLTSIGSAYLFELTPAAPAAEVLRTGTPPNPVALLPGLVTGPVIGGPWDPRIDHASFYPTATVDLLALSTQPPINLPIAAGTLVCSLPPSNQIKSVPAGTPFSIAVPLDCSLLGVTGCVQGASTGPSGLRLTNGFDITVGSC